MAETKAIILRQQCPTCEDLELFIGDGSNGEIFLIDIDKQLAWLGLIANNVRNSRKRNA